MPLCLKLQKKLVTDFGVAKKVSDGFWGCKKKLVTDFGVAKKVSDGCWGCKKLATDFGFTKKIVTLFLVTIRLEKTPFS